MQVATLVVVGLAVSFVVVAIVGLAVVVAFHTLVDLAGWLLRRVRRI